MSSYDLVILGSGTTAFAGALRAAERDARVLMVEQSQLGGTCVNWGCIPSKTLIHLAEVRFGAERDKASGLNLSAGLPDCKLVMAAKRTAVETLRRRQYQEVLEAEPKIDVRRGHGRFLSVKELQVGAEVLRSDRFLIACGGVPRVPGLPGLADVDYLTSYSALHLPCFPSSLIILGGGVIATEMGQMFSRFGVQVILLERGDRLLKEFDPRFTGRFETVLKGEGIEVVTGAETRSVFQEAGGVRVAAMVGGEERQFRAERLMLAVGTAPATEGIGLEKAGVVTNGAGFIRVDAELRTSAPGIWAAGDVTGPPLIAPAGAREAELAVDNLLDPDAHRRIDHSLTPMAVFIDPELATVGRLGEPGSEVVESWIDLERVAKAHVMGGREGGILMHVERGSGRILGVQILAPRAADIIHEAALAVRMNLTARDLAETVHVYPTIGDGLRLAAQDCLARLDGP